ncbi:MAG TPA: cyanophycinase [Gemmatimonadales bacterium]|nr:cyanophycinase [Gemmatimonadales bacterium]
MSPSRGEAGSTRGYIVPIGGAEEKIGDSAILRRFVKLCGGKSARIAIIPTASMAADTGTRYEKIFSELGARKAEALSFETRQECEDEELLDKLSEATGVFLTGGNQLRLSTHLGGTTAAKKLRTLNAAGVHIAGTSAGAAFLSEHMIAHGDEGSSPKAGSVTLAPGLGLTNRIIIDQHFRQRDRLGRLLTALAYNPFAIGLGLDEDTAAFVTPDNVVEVAGSGAVTVIDGSTLEFSSMDLAHHHDPVCMLGVKLHILVQGATFNLATREANAGQVAMGKG